ncbi:hypothetical protein BDZ89DRAFT_894599, partial [Hymenopellis radicata]
LSWLLFNIAIEPLAAMLRDSNLEGYKVNGILDRIITTLFADDTTVFMSKNDRFSELKGILDTWCAASGAKFNIKKTIIIPIGSIEHRTELMNERRSSQMAEEIPEGIHIAEDGESSRSLGSWVGTSWTRTVLQRVERTHPTLNGKRVGIQTYAASRTQYLATAEDMPKEMEKRFDALIHKFFWEHKNARVNKQMLKLPLDDGGQNLIDIKLRNDAIHIVHLESFLGLNGTTP